MSVRKCIKADLSRLCFHFSVVLTHECGKVNFFFIFGFVNFHCHFGFILIFNFFLLFSISSFPSSHFPVFFVSAIDSFCKCF